MRVERLADVGDHPLAKLGDEVEPHRGGQGEHQYVGAGEQEAPVEQGLGAGPGEAAVDQQPAGGGQRHRRGARDQQRQQRQQGVAPVRREEGQQPSERTDVAALVPAPGSGLHLLLELGAWIGPTGRAVRHLAGLAISAPLRV